MSKKPDLRKTIVYFVPAVVLAWGIYFQKIVGPFYLSRIDPEFVYLLNGLNCSILEFGRIGHVDHPGTPFQLLTGLFIRFTHLLFGQGPIVEDVISRPELYFSMASVLLTVITAWIILWLGKTASRTGARLFGVFVLQSSVFMTTVLINIPYRYMPDRMLMIIVLLVIGFTYKFIYQKNYSATKFAIYSGILMGVGFVTKFNFLPLLVIPVFMLDKWKGRFIYAGTFSIATFVSFMPIFDKIGYFESFIVGIINHDGLYGSGAEQVFNMQKFFHNIVLIFQFNISFTIVFVAAFVFLAVLLFRPVTRKENPMEFRFLLAYMVVMAVSLVMISKHYKNHYLIPVMSLTAFVFYVIWRINKGFTAYRHLNKIFALLLIVLLMVPVRKSLQSVPYWKHNLIEANKTAGFINENIPKSDFTLLRSSWRASPQIADGLLYGITYVDSSNLSYNTYEKVYPNILTYEGDRRPLMYFMMLDANNEAVFKSGKSIYLLSAPNRHMREVMEYVENKAGSYGISMIRDTVFSNPARNEFVIKLTNISKWKTLAERKYGFENILYNNLFADDGENPLSGNYILNTEKPCNGAHSLELEGELHQIPVATIKNVLKGDYVELTIKRRKNGFKEKGELVLSSLEPKVDSLYYFDGHTLSVINEDWEMVRLFTTIHHQPLDSTMICFYQFYGEGKVYVDDFSVKLLGKRP